MKVAAYFACAFVCAFVTGIVTLLFFAPVPADMLEKSYSIGGILPLLVGGGGIAAYGYFEDEEGFEPGGALAAAAGLAALAGLVIAIVIIVIEVASAPEIIAGLAEQDSGIWGFIAGFIAGFFVA